MILRDDDNVETESESDDDPMPKVDDGLRYPIDGKLMVAICERRCIGITSFILGPTSKIRYVL